MNTTPEQLELAADILRHNKPWESRYSSGGWMEIGCSDGPLQALVHGREIRIKPLSFAPIPDGATRHNPDNLTAEQVEEGWRLLVGSELDRKLHREGEFWNRNEHWKRFQTNGDKGAYFSPLDTIRVPLQTPYPDGSFVKDGKLVKPWVPKFKVGDRVVIKPLNESGRVEQSASEKHFVSRGSIQISAWWNESDLEPAPWTLSRHLPGFRPLLETEQWHRTDWTEEMLPEGWRPHLLGERQQEDDEWRWGNGWKAVDTTGQPAEKSFNHRRTRRPLPEPAKVQLGPEDWMRDGPWWIRQKGTTNAKMVVALRDVGLSAGHDHDWTTHSVTEHCERSNDGTTWSPCHKEGAPS